MTEDSLPHAPPARTISKEALAALPIGRYAGEIVVVENDGDLGRAEADFADEGVVGFDTETRPAFRPGERYLPALVQAATARAVYIFPLRWQPAHAVLARLLEKPSAVKTGVGLRHDLKVLTEVFPFQAAGIVDVGAAARGAGYGQAGLRNLAGLLLGFRIPKGASTSNWAARQLTPAQLTYAATDAWASRLLYLRCGELGILEPTP